MRKGRLPSLEDEKHMVYLHERPDWPQFHWNTEKLAGPLAQLRHKQGCMRGRSAELDLALRAEARLQALTEDIVNSSAIEGEILDRNQVRPALAEPLGVAVGMLKPVERAVAGMVAMTVDATLQYDQPLTTERLFRWHAALFPTGRSGMFEITVGGWRTDESGPMQVVSGPIGRERVHFEAPAATRIESEMDRFLHWLDADQGLDPVIKAAIAHLWFVTIHPFDDGNGRITRAIADLALARSEHSAMRFYSMSAQICKERKAYYSILQETQHTLDITAWLQWFLDCLDHAFDRAETVIGNILQKAAFWERHATTPLNDRQRLMLNRLLEGFQGKLTSSKWAKIAKVSQAIAARDIEDLIEHGILQKDEAAGRSTSYSLVGVG